MKTVDYFRGKSVLITGGSSGIGFAIANALVEMDAVVILLARDYEKLKAAKASILEKFPKAKVKLVSADVTDAETLIVLHEKYVRNHDTPDILINCAGVARPGYVEEIPLDVYKWTMDIDYHGTVNTIKVLLPGMIERGSGHIINFSSLAGVIGVFGYTAYSGAKFAIKGFSDALRTELKPKGIKVSIVYPPDTDTPQLAWEDQYKPFETRELAGSDQPIQPSLVAEETLKAVARGRYKVVPGFNAKLTYFVATRVGNWLTRSWTLWFPEQLKRKPDLINDLKQHQGGAGIRSLIDRWQQDQEFRENITYWQVTAARQAVSTPIPASLDPRLHTALNALGVTHLYSHQAEAVKRAHDGENLVIATGTASGKTLCYNLPAVQQALSNPNDRILYLFPTKALTQDQFTSLDQLLKAVPSKKPMPVNIFDGDTPQHMRSAMRKQSVFLMTNPDMLHQGILPHHAIWQPFFQGLSLVIIDEMHTYRGIFGSHFANLMRRLKRIAAFYGAFPKFILTSATIANPVELAEVLIDDRVSLIDQSGAPQGEKHFLLYNPPLVDQKLGLRKSSVQTSVNIGLSLLEANRQSLLFARTRRTVEMLLTYLLERLPYQQRSKVRGYRSGYLKSDRREIEQGFKSGSIRLVVATSALELGIDIGELESVILVGYPGSIATTLQRAGRAGRKQQDSLALLVATNDAMDQYLANHPEYLSNSPEKALVDPNNLLVLYQHLRCATFELPFSPDESFGPINPSQLSEIFNAMTTAGEVLSRNNTHYWVADAYPSAGISLRSSTPNIVSLLADGPDKPTLIGQMDAHSAEWLVHPQAVYLHEAETYLVEDLNLEQGVCKLKHAQPDYYTLPTIKTTIENFEVRSSQPVGSSNVSSGPLSLSIRVEGFRKIRWQTNETLERLPLDLPARGLETEGAWFSIGENLVNHLKELALWNSDPNDYGPGWPALRQKILLRDQYKCAACHQTFPSGELHVHHIQPFKTFADPLQANTPSNLVTLCHRCHAIVETRVRVISGMAGARHALRNIAPLLIMCDDADIAMLSEPKSILNNGQPAILVYDTIPGGVGLSNQLFEDHRFWLERAAEMISDCPCEDGCPACVGPFGEDGYGSKRESLALLKGLLHE